MERILGFTIVAKFNADCCGDKGDNCNNFHIWQFTQPAKITAVTYTLLERNVL